MASVRLLANDCNLYHLVVKRSDESFVTVASVFGGTGAPLAVGSPYSTFFPTVEEAVAHLENSFHSKVILEAQHLLGIVKQKNDFVIGFITGSEACATLPNGDVVKTVKEAKFVTINIDGYKEGNEVFEKFAIESAHYFCETYDISHPYPSQRKPWDCDEELCWNLQWRDIFVSSELPHLCICLLQGQFVVTTVGAYKIAYTIRRSSMNPGVRWLARGFNDRGGPGNEVEGELIFWNTEDGRVWTHFWRRGTIPLKWSTKLKTILSTHEEQVVDKNYCGATKKYFDRIHEKYGGVDIHCCCLLKQHEGGDEYQLFKAYGEAIEILNTKMNMPWVHFLPYDVYAEFKKDDKDGPKDRSRSVKQLMGKLGPIARNGFNHGENKQKEIVRINCADSLDRTNMVSWFYALLVMAEWFRQVGLTDVKLDDDNITNPEKFIPQDVLDFMAKAFVHGGNIISLMYTNTEAQRAEMIWNYAREKEDGSSALSISLQRRFHNIVTDPDRNATILKWTKNKHDFMPKFILDHRMFSVTSPFQKSALELRGRPSPDFIVGHKDEHGISEPEVLEVVLPAGLYLTGIWIYQHPTDGLHRLKTIDIEGVQKIDVPNVSTRTWARYPVNKNILRVVRLIFHTTPFVVGKIALECTRHAYSMPATSCEHEAQFIEKANEWANRKVLTFPETSELELIRINGKISVKRSQQLIANLGENPLRMNPNRFLVTNTHCPFCAKPIVIPEDPDDVPPPKNKFYLSAFYPSRLTDVKPEYFPSHVKVCDDCMDVATEFAAVTKELEKDVARIPIIHPKFTNETIKFGEESFNVAEGPHACFASSTAEGDVNALLTEKGGSIKVQGSADFTLGLMCWSQLEKVVIEADGAYTMAINEKDVDADISALKMKSNVLSFQLKGTFTLKKIAVIGKPVQNDEAHICKQPGDFDPKKHSGGDKHAFEWDEVEKIQHFDLHGAFASQAPNVDVQIYVKNPKRATNDLIFNFKNETETVARIPMKIPKISTRGKLVYRLKLDKPITGVDVFYLDTMTKVHAHKMKFTEVEAETTSATVSAAEMMKKGLAMAAASPERLEKEKNAKEAIFMMRQMKFNLK